MIIQVKGRPGQGPGPVSEENHKDDEILTPAHLTGESSSDKENKSEAKSGETKVDKIDLEPQDQLTTLAKLDSTVQEHDDSDEGWQEAVPKNRYPSGRRTRPSLAKLNTNFMNVTQQTSRSRGKSTNFTSPKTSSNEPSVSAAGSTSPASKKSGKGMSLNRKKNSSNTVGERPVNDKSALAVPACTEQINKPTPMVSPVSVKAGKLFSYKEVALAPPGTIVKLVAEQLPEDAAILDAGKVGVEKVKAKVTESENKHAATETKAKNVDSDEQGRVIVGGSELMSSPEEIKNAEAGKAAEESFSRETVVSDAKEGKSESVEDTNKTGLLNKSPTAKDSNGNVAAIGVNLEKGESDVELKAIDGERENLANGDSSPKSTVAADGEKQDACEKQKEMSKKLSASAPPYTPTTIPIFGSIAVPGFKDHGGILPSPPMLPVNHVRRSTPHQSVTARVPYGPRLSGGGYNRSGNRVPRSKPSFPNSTDSSGEANQFSAPRIMNPHAAEFIPSQPWVSNGYPVPPNGFLAGTEIAQNGYPLSPVAGGYPCNIPVTQPQNGLVVPAPVALEELPCTENSEMKSGNQEEKKNKAADEEVLAQETTETHGNGHLAISEEKTTAQETNGVDKCWGDYSDNEAEQIEEQIVCL